LQFLSTTNARALGGVFVLQAKALSSIEAVIAVGHNLRLVLAWLRMLLCVILTALCRVLFALPALKSAS
jgi:hypothetical protein